MILFLTLFVFLLSVESADFAFSVVKFSVDRGFFTAPFALTLASPKSLGNATTIRYMISNNKAAYGEVLSRVSTERPALLNRTSGTLFDPAVPIQITQTCYVRAIAFNATHSTNLTTFTYIFPRDVYDSLFQTYASAEGVAKIVEGLLAIPSMSITTVIAYPMANTEGFHIESKGELEWLDPANPTDHWLTHMGYEVYGGYSRTYPKKNFRIHFRDADGGGDDGDGQLDFRLFKGFDKGVGTARTFKSLDLRSHSQDGIFGFGWSWRPIYMKNIFADWTVQDIDKLVIPHSRYVHLYFNGFYMGFHHLRERIGGHFFTNYLGAQKDDYQAINSGREVGGNAILSPTYSTYIQNPSYPTANLYYDWKSFFGFVIYEHYAANQDLSSHNWQCGGPQYPKPWNDGYEGTVKRRYGGWKFFANDDDATFLNAYTDTTGNSMAGNSFNSLIAEKNVDFIVRFHDYQYKFLIREGGILTTASTRARFQRIFSTFNLDRVVPCELGRWAQQNEGFTPAVWRSYITNLYDNFIDGRVSALLASYAKYQYGTTIIGTPKFSLKDGAIVPAGTKLTISADVAKYPSLTAATTRIYYTLNENDPRNAGGLIVDKDAFYVNGTSVTITIDRPTIVTARVFSTSLTGGTAGWGVIDTVFVRATNNAVNCVLCGNIIFTEVNYHAKKGINQSEFVEIKNIGSTPQWMAGVIISRHNKNNYTFPSIWLQPGQFWVIGFFLEDFRADYNKSTGGRSPNDIMLMQLSETKEGDDLTIYDAFGNFVNHVSFEAEKPWSKLADGKNYTLVVDPQYYEAYSKVFSTKSSDMFRFWRYSVNEMGSPWGDDPAVPEKRRISLQFKFVSFEKDWVELFNPTEFDIDISGWSLQDRLAFSSGNHDFILPEGSIIPAKSTLKIKPPIDFERGVGLKNPCLFKWDPVLKMFPGDFVEFVTADKELAF